MRVVKARSYFEQMRGRGVRVIDDTDLQAVTPDAHRKDRFVLIDAVGITETELVDIHRSHEQMLDDTSADKVIEAGYSQDATDRARRTIESFCQFVDENKNEITALQILYSQPYGARQLTFQQIKELADTISLPP